MKIQAVRVREVGALRDPVALEGLSGGLDVLAGPNELGKSTLFRALESAFGLLYTTKSEKISDWMLPDTGGAPIIEVDFETGAKPYRLRKRFFSSPKASLTGLDDGTVARGADAEARLAELLAKAGGADRLGLLWVGQTRSLDAFDVAGGTRAGLKGLIERELAAATGGEQAHAVQNLIRQRLDGLLTGARRQPKGAYKDAVEAQARLTDERAALQDKVAQGRDGFDRLAALRDSHGRLADAGKRQQGTGRIASARVTLETARAAADKRRAGEEQWKRLDQDSALAMAALADFDRRSQDAAGLDRSLAALTQQHAAAATGRSAALAAASGGAQELAALELDALTLQGQLEAARRQADYEALAARLAEAEALSARLNDLNQALAINAATAGLLRQAEIEARALETLRAQLTIGTTRVSIAYEAGAEGRISRDGVPVPVSADIVADRPLVLIIPGIGRISILPGASEDPSQTVARIERHSQALAAVLVNSGAATLDDLREQTAERAEYSTEHDRTVSRLQGVCPEGLETLRARLATLMALMAHEQSANPQPLFLPTPEAHEPAPAAAGGEALVRGQFIDTAAIDAELQSILARCKSVDAANRAAQSQAQQHGLALAKHDAEVAALGQRQAALLAKLPPVQERGAHRSTLDTVQAAAVARARESLLTLAALREREPAPEQMLKHEAELAAAIAADSEAVAAVTAQARDMASLEATLQRDALDGIAERLAECDGELAAANRRLAALNRDIGALDLLKSQFERVETETRERYLAPVLSRLAPFLQTILPGADLRLGESFAATGLARNGRSEAIERLSHGTREQIAVLVRLGLAALLADTGEPLPLILDDALVYSDDERITASFAALRMAAERHQVIVLTCRSKAFQPLGGVRLALAPWLGFED